MAKQVTDRQGATEMVASAAETHAERINKAFDEMFGDCLEAKEKMPDVGLLLKLVARKQRRLNKSLVEASDAYDKELSDDSGPREARDRAAAALTAEVVGIRSTVESAFGAAMLTSLGIDGKTEVEPKAILAKAKRLVSELKDPGRKWPKPARKGVKVNPGEWVGDLEEWINALEKALKDVARETREAQAASDAKERAMGANDDSFMRIARFVSGLFFLVRDDKLAKKVRPSARRPGMVLESSGEGSEGGSDEEAVPLGGESGKSDG
jgi:hypothetical protein